MKILNLTLKKKCFDLIASGDKVFEFREIKPYWTKRFIDKRGNYKQFDEVHFKNGYSKDSPFMRVEFKGISKTATTYYIILLGKVLEVKNYKKYYTQNRLAFNNQVVCALIQSICRSKLSA